MSSKLYAQPWLTIIDLVKNGDAKQLSHFVDGLSPAETARAVSRLDEETRGTLLLLLTPGEAAEVLHELPDTQAASLIEDIRPEEAAAIIDHMPGDEQADILADVDTREAEAILEAMPSKQARDARKLMAYPSDTAGGIMTTAYLCYKEEMTVSAVLEDLQAHNQLYSDYEVQYAYIVSNRGRLRGVLRMRDLLLSVRGKAVGSIAISKPVHVLDYTPLEELIQLFDQHGYLGVPVTNKAGILLGIVRRGQVMEASGRRAEKSFLKVSGIIGGEEFRSMPLVKRSFRRLSWLSINIFLNIIAASVIAFYQDTLSAVIALAVFLPIISDMSGCSGNQAVAVSIRELTLGLIRPYEVWRVFFKEIGIGLTNGLVLGTLLGSVAFLWKGNLYLGLVVGGALATNTIVAVCLGGVVPLILRGMRIDPALASGPILTTVTDMCGFFLALSFASAALSRLTL